MNLSLPRRSGPEALAALAPPGPVLDLSRPGLRVHLVGVGGAGMSALATVLVAMGHRVSGSDARPGPVLDRLARSGVQVEVGHDPSHVGPVDALAYSTAIKPGNPEVQEAHRLGVRVLTRPQLTGAVCRSRRVLCVSGTHGKSTTTAMLAAIASAAGWAPGYLVGADLAGGQPGASWGRGPWLVVEGDESDASFLYTGPFGALVTNVEPDHLDFYGDEVTLEAAFDRFLDLAAGPRVACADDPGAARLSSALGQRGVEVVTYGRCAGAQARVVDVSLGATASTFGLAWRGQLIKDLCLGAPGEHNVLNAAGALALALEAAAQAGGPGSVATVAEAAPEALAGYHGVSRRLEVRGQKQGVTFIDDYAHLPSEVKVGLQAVRRGGWDRVVAVFQPHRYTRTQAQWRNFGPAFAEADIVVVTGIYPAGEAALAGVDGSLVAQAVQAADRARGRQRPVYYVETRQELVDLLHHELRPGDLCLTMGAGDLTTLPAELLGAGMPTVEAGP